jgi:hypothetical protein
VQDRISAELGRLIAQSLPARPDWIDLAKANLMRWKSIPEQSPSLAACYDEWLAILNGPIEGVTSALVGSDERSMRLRQNNPFAGALDYKLVQQIKQKIRHEQSAA